MNLDLFGMSIEGGPEETKITDKIRKIIVDTKYPDFPFRTDKPENEEQQKFLVDQKCNVLQGFYFSESIKSDEFEKLFLDTKNLATKTL